MLAIVGIPLLLVRKRFVRFRYLFELGAGGRVRVHVGVVFFGELEVGLFYFRLRAVRLYPEFLIKVFQGGKRRAEMSL